MNGTHDNDNFDPWQSIGLQAALIVNKLRCQAQLTNSEEEKREIDTNRKQSGNGADGQNNEAERADIERRIRDILAMEDRLRRKRI